MIQWCIITIIIRNIAHGRYHQLVYYDTCVGPLQLKSRSGINTLEQRSRQIRNAHIRIDLTGKWLIKDSVELKWFDPIKPFVVTVDASHRGIGAALLQQGEPIEFASCSMTDKQQRYTQIENNFWRSSLG